MHLTAEIPAMRITAFRMEEVMVPVLSAANKANMKNYELKAERFSAFSF